MKIKLKKGDIVKMLSGKDKGKTGKLIKVNPKDGRAAVEGLNLVKKHMRPRKQGEKGEVIGVPRMIALSKAAIICSSCKKATRVGFREEGKNKIRFCKKCGAAL
ncbi:MAG: 50S ribosomal protein L24 [Candidatus Liptonbacteria bacterium RIFOXYC1_FULL_36_8]|uniref:Large ribosomal subunit protein uL24 n=3 Tax=Candidatus Liptoniibacteriota TaxID=1817909 RepID=A0A1G2CPB8_9BACT|nr:MAG: 50S ribosomal protein L24 [Candidatus Liptonbacteria bacterium RIFOXYB1_FULL_36_10]OGZ04131.1 MAG: 50S ribosomal protein L24 [Candidatus Liptonbacteria bacterium RIFOXYC1_FULL_36_8]OGZ04540.1 MAG: 50S ribosomal protein L24 [Candidatus Liptonbacteria bacterium RIFOXYD1_FULL_36_11]